MKLLVVLFVMKLIAQINIFKFCSSFKAYLSINKSDVICQSEIYPDSSLPTSDDNLEKAGYNLYRADLPSDTKRGGVCIYYKNCFPLSKVNVKFHQECIIFEIKIGDKLCNFISLC